MSIMAMALSVAGRALARFCQVLHQARARLMKAPRLTRLACHPGVAALSPLSCMTSVCHLHDITACEVMCYD